MLNAVLFLLASVYLAAAQNVCPPECENDNGCDKKPIDVVFLVDGSESIETENFNRSLAWVLDVIRRLKPSSRPEGLQVSLAQYSTEVQQPFLPQVLTSDPSSVFESSVLSIKKISKGTDIIKAVDYVNNDIFPRTRPGHFKILITLTDGDLNYPANPSDNRPVREVVIQTARKNFNVMLAVGVGSNLDLTGMRLLTHNADIINVVDYATLNDDTYFDRILNSTLRDCIEFCAWCGTSTKDSVTVNYCVRNMSGSDVNLEMIDNFHLELSGNGLARPLSKASDEFSAVFNGLDPYTEYNIGVNATMKDSELITVFVDNVNCSTKGCLEIMPKCENRTEFTLTISYVLMWNGVELNPDKSDSAIGKYIEEFEIEISSPAREDPLKKRLHERTAIFSGLNEVTEYTITIRPIFKNDEAKTKVEAKPASKNCTTLPCPDDCKPKPLNLVFLIDGSESVSQTNFSYSLRWVSDVVNKFRKLDEDYRYKASVPRREMRVTIVQYSTEVKMELDNQKIEPSTTFNTGDIVQLREGTKPYIGLAFINNNNNEFLFDNFYNVLIALHDKPGDDEVIDMDEVNAAKSKYDKILAVGVGGEYDLNSGFLKLVAHNTEPFSITETTPLNDICDVIEKQSHEDCIQFHATCECDDTKMAILLQYNVTLWGSLQREDEVITGYQITFNQIQHTRSNIPIGSRSSLFDESTNSGLLSPHTTYGLTIAGIKRKDKCVVVIPHTVQCATRAVIRPTVNCSFCNSSAVQVSIGWGTGFQNDFSLMQNVVVGISGPETSPTTQTIPPTEQPKPFTGLQHSTPYTISVTPNEAPNVCAAIEPVRTDCNTKEACEVKPIDLVFLIDGSESISEDAFKQGLQWISETIGRVNSNAEGGPLRVAAVQYSEEQDSILPFTEGTNANIPTTVAQLRSSTKTYGGLRYITNSLTPITRADSCKIFVTLSDGDSTEPVDNTAIDNVRIAYDVMIAVGYNQPIGDELVSLSTIGEPITIQDSTSILAIVNKLPEICCRKNSSQRVHIIAYCEATIDTISVSYYAVPVRFSNLINSYQANISEDGLPVQTSPRTNDTDVTFTNLIAATSYTIEVTGEPLTGSNAEVVKATLICMTKDPCSPSPCQNGGACARVGNGHECICQTGWTGLNCTTVDVLIKPVVECVFTTDSDVIVGFKMNPTEHGYDTTLISGYSVAISPSGTGTNPMPKAVGDLTAVFSGLQPSTDYSFIVNIDKASGANVNVESGSVICRTKAVSVPTCSTGLPPSTNGQPQTSVSSTETTSTRPATNGQPQTSVSSTETTSTRPVQVTETTTGVTRTVENGTSASVMTTRIDLPTAASSAQPLDNCLTTIIILSVCWLSLSLLQLPLCSFT